MKRFEAEMISGWLHEPDGKGNERGLLLTHGAGSHCQSPLLTAIAETFATAGYWVLRCDLPYRQLRAQGPPRKGDSERDREGLRRALEALREYAPAGVILSGHSYGGRMATILAAEQPSSALALLALSYPLRPPRELANLRTAHFPQLATPVLFIHGARDPFGSPEEMTQALTLIPAQHHVKFFDKTGHELNPKLAPAILEETQCFVNALKR